jgi:hypothetical protein
MESMETLRPRHEDVRSKPANQSYKDVARGLMAKTEHKNDHKTEFVKTHKAT